MFKSLLRDPLDLLKINSGVCDDPGSHQGEGFVAGKVDTTTMQLGVLALNDQGDLFLGLKGILCCSKAVWRGSRLFVILVLVCKARNDSVIVGEACELGQASE
jgi:hypothetical protein